MKKVLLAPSVLSANKMCLENECVLVKDGGADIFHIDFMDQRFVPNFGIDILEAKVAKQSTGLPLDIHLMAFDPALYAEKFIKVVSPEMISFHFEAEKDIKGTIKRIRELGSINMKVGIAINPGTAVKKIYPFLEILDFVLVMSVWPGKSGQSFINTSIEKIKNIRSYINKNNLKTLIEVDGGICRSNITEIVAAGADIVVAGNAAFGQRDIKKAVQGLIKAC